MLEKIIEGHIKLMLVKIGILLLVGATMVVASNFLNQEQASGEEELHFIVPAHWKCVEGLKRGERESVPPRRLWFFEAIRDFWEEHPEIKFEMEEVNYQDIASTFITRSMAGDPPDIVTYDNSFTRPLVDSGLLAPLDQFAGPSYWNDFHDQVLESNLSVGDHIYLLPAYHSPITFFYNKKLFEKAGLDPENPPRTWDEVIEYSRAIQEKTDASGIGMGASMTYVSAVRPIESLVYSQGGSIQKDGYAIFETPEMKKALQLYYDLINTHKVMPEEVAAWDKQDWRNNFITERVAMTVEGSWYYGDYVRALGEEVVGFGSLPTFTKDQIASPWMEIFGWSMSKECGESDRAWDAWRLIDHLASRHTLFLAAKYQEGLPARKSMIGDSVYQKSDFLSFASAYIGRGGRGRAHIIEQIYWERLLLEAIQVVVLERKTVDQALSDAQRQYDVRVK